MAALLELCRKYFGTDKLYEVLNTNKQATEKEGINFAPMFTSIFNLINITLIL